MDRYQEIIPLALETGAPETTKGRGAARYRRAMTDVTGRKRTEALGVTYILMNCICRCGCSGVAKIF